MVFSSILFIYYFLPLLFICYFIVPNRWKNFVLLIFSLGFYFLGEPKYIVLLLLSCIINYGLSKYIAKRRHSKLFMVLGLLYNIGQLVFFKYTDFLIANVNQLFPIQISYLYIVMPIGISFYTFQSIGYLLDVYHEKHQPATHMLDFMLYICMFPQLIAGPIVRYSDIEHELNNRVHNYANFAQGVSRFVIGLSKKVLLADVLGELLQSLIMETVLASWIKAICFPLQLYFDFSGYSDMAIGLGLMFGFHLPKNFDYPFMAETVTDFWHRWHISLSSWFRDYVYIPLGGNRTSKVKWLGNVFLVWFLTGFWHGANWNFILWGLYFGIILIMEKLFLGQYLDKSKIIKRFYTLCMIMISFMIFRNEHISQVIIELKNMMFLNDISMTSQETIYYLKSYAIIIVISIIAATPLCRRILSYLKGTKYEQGIRLLEPLCYLGLLILATAFLIDASYHPFLYFRF